MSQLNKGKTLNIYVLLLLVTIFTTGCFAYWLMTEDLVDVVHRMTKEYDRLETSRKYSEAQKVFKDVFTGQEKLHPYWLPLIRFNRNGYIQLDLMMKVLRYDPDVETVYSEIERFIQVAPPAFHNEVKDRYLSDFGDIPGINQDWLIKYNLLLRGGDQNVN